MKSPLHILHLEDDVKDATLIKSVLETGGIQSVFKRVENRDDFVQALEQGGIDLVLSDFSVPAFDGLAATEIVRARWPAIPVILVSGAIGEELAIDALKSGVTDYVLKARLSRLVPAVCRAMKEVEAGTERRRLENQFIEAQKMEVIGQLASGVAHDFNNILAVVMGYTELISSTVGSDNAVQEYTEAIRHASERAAGLTRQLLVFSRKQAVQPVILDLNEVVMDLDKMLRRLIDENIEMTMNLGEPPGFIMADAGYIGQVVMNLVVNARDAMPNGGALTIETALVAFDEKMIAAHSGASPGAYVILRVRDTGTGMTEEVKRRLFEVFFTTKPKGKGTGLGLATCQTIVQLCGGRIEVHSELGQGTLFEIYFPRVFRPPAAVVRSGQPVPIKGGNETVLVVEDEPALRHLVRDVLGTLGYEVLSAANGQEALHIARDHKGAPIRLVITDVVMPVMGGKVMAEWLNAIYPDLSILFTSGYTDETITHHGVLDPGVEFLPKPYTTATLARRVRELLDKVIAARVSAPSAHE